MINEFWRAVAILAGLATLILGIIAFATNDVNSIWYIGAAAGTLCITVFAFIAAFERR